ncbi:tRNA epoxyqueuosine(34) reductase QueG [Roseibium polysiphoniae]|uniref:tRNA epoxyqueuosine(34) reductase QueG n=1 Tax=Roseibium polysiphoniae TaxID=2571221 RepID=UPI001FE31EF6|nr:tRNA epoxyqueuosine(34) reductase QueG [Roseibium polysiphoniae]
MVRSGQITAEHAATSGREDPGHAGGSNLCGSGLLSNTAAKPGKTEKLIKALEDKASSLGFDGLRITSATSIPQAPERLRQFLDAGHHGSMGWMRETAERRGDPRKLWPEVRSVIMLAMNYGPEDAPLAHLEDPRSAGISVYARHRDYHDVIKGRLKELANFLGSRAGGDVKVFVDTAPVMEKPLAEAAGLGWQGKHTNLVSRELGSWFFLGSIFTTLELPPSDGEIDHCGSCRACLESCPTDAFPAPYQIDARRCISYLTIEHAGPIPTEFRKPMGNRIYGCDDCLAACPWNKFASTASEAKLIARDELKSPQLGDLLALDDAAFRKLFSGSPIKRIGRNRFLRNVLIAAGNSSEPEFLAKVRALLDDDAPIVRGAAAWAFRQLAPEDERSAEIARRLESETDPDVREEWAA